MLLRLKRTLKRLGTAEAPPDTRQPAASDWHEMLLRAEASDRDRRLAAAEAALNRLGRSEPN